MLAVIQDPFLPNPSPHPLPVITSVLAQSNKPTKGKRSVLPIYNLEDWAAKVQEGADAGAGAGLDVVKITSTLA